MPIESGERELYSRGGYSLGYDEDTAGARRSPNLYIFYYDTETKRGERVSTRTADIADAELALDRLYLKRERGIQVCPTCNRPWDHDSGYQLAAAIADYLIVKKEKMKLSDFTSTKSKLMHILNYMEAIDQTDMLCEQVDEEWVADFREWAFEVPIVSKLGKVRDRTPGTVEGSVRMLAAAINLSARNHNASAPAGFSAQKASEVSRTPAFRANIDQLASMFDYCINPKLPDDATEHQRRQFARAKTRQERAPLLRFLQLSVATWARPEAVTEFSLAAKHGQWDSTAKVLHLNPLRRKQNRKYRPSLPMPDAMARLLDQASGFYVGPKSVRTAFRSMVEYLDLPRDRQLTKMIRRAVSHMARRSEYLGEEHWVQGSMYLGHHKTSTSDLYALVEPNNLGRALDATTVIIDEIEQRVPGAFSVENTWVSVNGA